MVILRRILRPGPPSQNPPAQDTTLRGPGRLQRTSGLTELPLCRIGVPGHSLLNYDKRFRDCYKLAHEQNSVQGSY